MEIRQLQHFLAIADAGTFTAAAARLHISQPGLSSSIRALERSLGVRLFVRTRQRAEITDAGRELYPGARRALATLEALESQLRRDSRTTHCTVRMGCIPSFAGLDLAALLSRFAAEHPNVDIDVVVGLPTRLFADLADDVVELAVVTMPLDPPTNVSLTPLITYPMVLACPVGHRLSRQRSVELDELADEPFVDFDPSLTARQVTDQALADAAVDRTVRVTCNEIGALLELVAHGLGIAIVPRPLAIATRVPVAMVPLANSSLVWTVAVATRPGGVHTEAGQALWNLIAATSAVEREQPVRRTRHPARTGVDP